MRPDRCGRRGFIDAEMIRAEIHDIAARLFFVSGSPGLVNTMKGVLGAVGVKRGSIRTACFPGYPS